MSHIAENRRARYEYSIEEQFEAGMVLEGWEVKAIRAGQVQLTDGYVLIRDGELYLIGCRINALRSASTHVTPEADRTKKLLVHKAQMRRLIGKIEQKGFTLVPLNLHYKGGRVKAELAGPRRPRRQVDVPRAAASACSRSACRSAAASSPTENRTRCPCRWPRSRTASGRIAARS